MIHLVLGGSVLVSKIGYPKFLRITYTTEDYGKYNGFTGYVTGPNQLVDVFERFNIRKDLILKLEVNDQELNEVEISNLYKWMEGVLRKRAHDENDSNH